MDAAVVVPNEVRLVSIAQMHRLTVDEYVRIVHDLEWDMVELVDGIVYDVGPTFGRQADTVMRVFRQIDAHLDAEVTYVRCSVRLGPSSLFDPNIAVLDGSVTLDPDDFVPASAVRLIVEVSGTAESPVSDLKLGAYAAAGVPEVWLIDPRPDVGALVRHRDPDGETYGTVERFDVGENAAGLDVAAMLRH